jgi:hypothetical protein
LSGLPVDEIGALTGALGTGAALSLAAGAWGFLVPLAAGLVFGADIAVKVKEENIRL